MILARDSLSAISEGYRFLLSPLDYAYTQGALVHRGQDGPLTPADMVRLQAIYEDWWLKSKDRPLEALRADWSNGIRPLSGSEYFWW